MKNIAKEKILNNELCLGVGLRQSRTVDIGKIMATCGYDWLFIDMEHNSMDIDIASQISVAAQDAGITPIVRVPDFAHHHATRVLDCGAMGVVFPHVDNADIAKSQTTLLFDNRINLFVLVNFPITEKSKPHLLNIFSQSFSFPSFKTINILSWLSESIIS